jgi:hypothetical protein
MLEARPLAVAIQPAQLRQAAGSRVEDLPFVRRLGNLAERMRADPERHVDETRMSMAERCCHRALQASDNGEDASTFWRLLGDELRRWFDENPIPR